MPVTAKNVSKHPVTVVLDQPAFYAKQHGWKRTTVKFANATAGGGLAINEIRRSQPGVLILQPGESVTGLHAAFQNCSQVPGLVSSRVLQITAEQSNPTPTPTESVADHAEGNET